MPQPLRVGVVVYLSVIIWDPFANYWEGTLWPSPPVLWVWRLRLKGGCHICKNLTASVGLFQEQGGSVLCWISWGRWEWNLTSPNAVPAINLFGNLAIGDYSCPIWHWDVRRVRWGKSLVPVMSKAVGDKAEKFIQADYNLKPDQQVLKHVKNCTNVRHWLHGCMVWLQAVLILRK